MNTRLQADYAELALQYLDNIPVEKEQDFEIIAEALKSITEPTVSHTVPQNLAGRIKSLKEIIDNPDWYVQNSKLYDQFKEIIIGRVAAKINEVQNLSPEEKQKYIADQKKIKEVALANQEIMGTRRAPAPGSEAHVISEQQMLQEMQSQGQLQQEPMQIQNARANFLNRIQSNVDRLRERLNNLPSQEELARRMEELTNQLRGIQNLPAETIRIAQMFEIQGKINEVINLRNERQDLEIQITNLSLTQMRSNLSMTQRRW
jgi:hypothetical protein